MGTQPKIRYQDPRAIIEIRKVLKFTYRIKFARQHVCEKILLENQSIALQANVIASQGEKCSEHSRARENCLKSLP